MHEEHRSARKSAGHCCACAPSPLRPDIRLRLVHVGGVETADDMAASRALGSRVALREWYTGLMHAVATQPKESIYKAVACSQ